MSTLPFHKPLNCIGNTAGDRSLAQSPDMSFGPMAVKYNMFRLPVFAFESLPFTAERLKMQRQGEDA